MGAQERFIVEPEPFESNGGETISYVIQMHGGEEIPIYFSSDGIVIDIDNPAEMGEV